MVLQEGSGDSVAGREAWSRIRESRNMEKTVICALCKGLGKPPCLPADEEFLLPDLAEC